MSNTTTNLNFTAVIASDLHLRTVDKYGKLLSSGINSRLQDRLDNIKKSVDYALDKDVDYWICLGDVFDKINPAEFLRDKFIELMAPLIKKGIPIIILIGNHDTDYKVHSFMTEAKLLDTLGSGALSIISEPALLKLGGVECLFIPFDTDEAIAEQLIKYKNKIIFGHMGVKGAMVSGTEYILSLGTNPALFKPHRFAFLGHYHKSQVAKKWMYIGSIAKVDFGERNDKKGFTYLEASDTSIKHKFIDVNDRVFFQHTIHQTEDPDFGILRTWTNLKGKVLKLTFVGEEDWYLRFNLGEIRSIILKTGDAHRLFMDHKTIIAHRVRVPEIDSSSSWDNGIEVYCRKTKRPEMEELGKMIMREVL